MKSSFLFLFLCLVIMVPSVSAQKKQPAKAQSNISGKVQNGDRRWKTVDSLAEQGLPQSALDIVAVLMAQGQKNANTTEFLKANMYELKLRAQFEENYLEKYITERERVLAGLASPARQVIHSILAELYWQYYTQNRWQILDRTVMDAPAESDITKWDVNQFIVRVTDHYRASLEDGDLLQSISLKEYDPILELADSSKIFRPTLYDLLANRAIDFFASEESSITRPVNTFVMKDSRLLGDARDFVAMQIESADSLSFHYQALTLYKQLIAFHLTDKDFEALVDADLSRLNFVYTNINHKLKDSLYLNALSRIEKTFSGLPVSALVMESIASYYFNKENPPERILQGNEKDTVSLDLVKAREWCLKVIQQFPKSTSAKNCLSMLNSIEEPYLEFTANKEVIPVKEFPVLLKFKNVDHVWFRIVETPYRMNDQYRDETNKKVLYALLSAKPVESWSVELPDPGDYRQHSSEIIVPAIKTGNYILIVSNNDAFKDGDTTLTYSYFQASNLTYLSRIAPDGSGLVYVVDRSNGHNLKGVKVQSFSLDYDYKSRDYKRVNREIYTTRADGSFALKAPPANRNTSLSFEFSYKGDSLIAENYFPYYHRGYNEGMIKEQVRTFFFTDRAIYRPGQPLYFKGIVVASSGDSSRIMPGFKSTVTLFDVNGQKVSSLDVVANDYGSFSGNFMLPSSGLTGQMRLDNESGSIFFNVEEYKRPKFEVTFQPQDSSFKLDETINMTGVAMTYSGMPVSGASVSYRVVRSATFPFIKRSFYIWPPFNVPEAEIVNGKITTDEEGKFKISFTATPDPSDFGDFNPLYTFMVYADVTDINGETQSGQSSVSVSKKALLIETDMPEVLDASKLDSYTVKATNLEGRPVPTSVKVEIHRLEEASLNLPRNWEIPDTLVYKRAEFNKRVPGYPYMNDDKRAAKKEELVFTENLNTAKDSTIILKELNLTPARYLVTLSAVDAFGSPVSVEKEVVVYDPDSKKIPEPSHLWLTLLNPEPQAGETLRILSGSSVNGRLLLEIQMNGEIIKHEWFDISSQQVREIALPANVTGQMNLLASLVYNNNIFKEQFDITVSDKSKQLDFTFETFRSTLLPGGSEKWKIKISDSEGKPLNAELLAGMYDASLDAFVKHEWYFSLFTPWRSVHSWRLDEPYRIAGSSHLDTDNYYHEPYIQGYDKLNWFGYGSYNGWGREGRSNYSKSSRVNVTAEMVEEDQVFSVVESKVSNQSDATGAPSAQIPETKVEPQVRRNLQETAFFFPHLVTNEAGEIFIEFTVPESLTRWNFMGLSHTRDLRISKFNKQVVTAKELMVTPNLPRYLRDGDNMVIQAKVSNLSPGPMQGEARLQLLDAITLQPVDDKFNVKTISSSFDILSKGNATVSWNITIPQGIQAVMVRVTAIAGNHSDGEEVLLPILTNRMLVTETLPLPVNGNQTKKFDFTSLGNQASSTTLKNHRLTLEFTSNPAWYAVQALPWLEALERNNTDQVFNRFYVNSLASHIANSSPKIRGVFESWKNSTPDALLSNLEKNQELKALVIEETPWLMDAKNESEQKKRIALMFDLNRLASQKTTALAQLQQSQSANGGWPWFPGMPESRYITQWIVTGMGKLHYLKVNDLAKDDRTRQTVQQAFNYLGERLVEDYRDILKDSANATKGDHLGYEHIQFLYASSYLNGTVQMPDKAKTAIRYFSDQTRKYWQSRSLYAQAMIALFAGRNGDMKTANKIIASLREKAITSDEMGTYWRDNRGGYFWYQAPVETQALLIELFEEMGNNKAEVDGMKTWLIKQKQTQSWSTSKATAEAVYALLLRGSDWLQTDPSVSIKVGDNTIDPSNPGDVVVEEGTGYFKTSWSGSEITPSMANITVSKSSDGPAWGALYWQYFENLDKIKAANSPLAIKKQLFIRELTDAGPRLTAITAGHPLEVGQQLVVRVEITSDRDLEFVHLKDMRASAFEPVSTLSRYQWKGGLGYYESTRDASTNFFFNYLQKGTHVFEYQLVVSQKGEFSNGISTIQCMYAPEFSAHSEGFRVVVE